MIAIKPGIESRLKHDASLCRFTMDFQASTPKLVGEIAELPGFDSAFHSRLSAAGLAQTAGPSERPNPKRVLSKRG